MKKIAYILLSVAILACLLVISFKSLPISSNQKTLSLVSQSGKPILRVKFANFWKNAKPFDFGTELISEILSENYDIEVVQGKDCDVVIEGVLFHKKEGVNRVNYGNAVKIFTTWEAVKPNVEQYDLAIGFNFIDHPNYIRVPLYYNAYRDKVNENYNRGQCNPNKKNFACFLVRNGGDQEPKKFDGCIARNRMFHKLSLYKKVLSGGPYLNNIGAPVPGHETFKWLNNCKFTIAYENETFDGYMTEKVFQAYYAGTIPIYYGDSKSLSGINKKAIIYAGDFATENALAEYIQKIDQDDQLYCDIWNQSIIIDKDQNYETIKANLKSKLDQVLKEKLNRNNNY